MAKGKAHGSEDGDYRPDPDAADEDEEFFAMEIDDIELIDLNGNVTTCRGPDSQVKQSEPESESEQQRIVGMAKKDPRFETHTLNRKIRFAGVVQRGVAAAALRYQAVIACSDDWKGMGKLPKERTKIIDCKAGNYISADEFKRLFPENTWSADRTKSLAVQRKTNFLLQMTDEEISYLMKNGYTDSDPCECDICKRRRENSTFTQAKSGLRSGKKLGWEGKYGDGRTL